MKNSAAWIVAGLLFGSGQVVVGQTIGSELEAKLLGYGQSLTAEGTADGRIVGFPTGEIVFEQFTAFCVEPSQNLRLDTILMTVSDPANLTNVAIVQRILGGYSASAQTDLDAAGAQWAIWEAIFDDPANPSFQTGSVTLDDPNSSVAARALDFLANAPVSPELPVLYLTHPKYQDIIVVVPEPAVALLTSGALALLLLRRRSG